MFTTVKPSIDSTIDDTDKRSTIITSEGLIPKVEVWKSNQENLDDINEALLLSGNDPMPEEPETPLPGECCMSGCRVCVYDLYEQNLNQYHADLEKWKMRERKRLALKNPHANQEVTIEAKSS